MRQIVAFCNFANVPNEYLRAKYRYCSININRKIHVQRCAIRDGTVPKLATSTDHQFECITVLSMAKALVVDMLQTHAVSRATAVECVQFYWVLTAVYTCTCTTTRVQVFSIVNSLAQTVTQPFSNCMSATSPPFVTTPQRPDRLWGTPRCRRVKLTAVSILWWRPIKPRDKFLPHTLWVKYTPLG